MKVAVFSSKAYDIEQLSNALPSNSVIELTFFEPHLNEHTVSMAKGFDAVCCFVDDTVNKKVASALRQLNIKLVTLRCAGFNNVDLEACEALGIYVTRVPEYSPCAVAEHAVALILDLNRNMHEIHCN